ncbi:MAG: hypothetical protein WA414_06950 [Acidobacteriaceae bacterium]|jgi:hypothetical protein
MSLIRNSDVKNHLGPTDTSVYPFGLKRSDVETDASSQEPGAVPTDISISPSHPIAAEAVPNAQVGGSIGVQGNADKSGKGSW